jgi:hypothetical protein
MIRNSSREFFETKNSNRLASNNEKKKIIMLKRSIMPVTFALLALAFTGCTTADPTKSSTHAEPLKANEGAKIDLTKYQIATVVPFSVAQGKDIDPSVGAKFASDIAVRLQYDFGSLFQEVRQAAPLNQPNELVVCGTITAYKPGDKFARAMLIGLGAASFKGELTLKDAASQQIILDAPFDKLWAWGGWLGATKDIEDMKSEAAASVAGTIARAKGWQPSTNNSTAVQHGK